MKSLYIVQAAENQTINGLTRVIHFVLGVYSTKAFAKAASNNHAIEIHKEQISWEASQQLGYTSNCTYSIYVRNLNADCLTINKE